MDIKYTDLPRKVKKGLKKSFRKDIDQRWKDKEIKITTVVKCSRDFYRRKPDFKGYAITGYRLGYKTI